MHVVVEDLSILSPQISLVNILPISEVSKRKNAAHLGPNRRRYTHTRSQETNLRTCFSMAVTWTAVSSAEYFLHL